ncbi:uncharacterized protein LOC135340539 isoform X1 [Halichondria panicea]|uniref:uncharacterized protein LOC135340539 isoform X1 n=1 Tax=Halichondria panicea TaxID=6063 RepID=UPI00312B8990
MSHKSNGVTKKKFSRVNLALNEQSREADKSSTCRKIVCDILTLRVLGYILKQPPSCIFIFTLTVISVCLPFIGLYIAGKSKLPDLDAMQNWNSYIGKLGHNNYCFKVNPRSTKPNNRNISSILPSYPPFNKTIINNRTMLTTCVELEFDVHEKFVKDQVKKDQAKKDQSKKDQAKKDQAKKDKVKNIVLVANLIGQEIGTQIKCDGERIDGQVFVHFWLDVSPDTLSDTKCPDGYCRVNGSVLITAPSKSVPTRLPQVHEDFTFETQVINCKKLAVNDTRCPTLCQHSLDLTVPNDGTEVADIVMATDCSEESEVRVVNEHKFGAKVNDIIKIILSDTDKTVAAHHMYLAAVAVAALSLVFTLGILLTDRPTDPKPSVE